MVQPLHMVRKPDATWRMTGDYRALNAHTKPDRYPIPNILDFNARLSGMKYFTKLDLVKAFYHIPMAEEDIEKTAVITPFGLFEFLYMPFGLRNAAQTFQRFIDNLIRDFDFAYAYIDDILIASATEEEHRQHVMTILERLDEAGLVIHANKSEYMREQLVFLGHDVTAAGIAPNPEKVKAVLDFPKPKTVHELRKFLGMINFYRRAIKHAAHIQSKLFALIKTNKKKDMTPVAWTSKASKAFLQLKDALAQAALLAHPDPAKEVAMATDASNFAIGATLYQFAKDDPSDVQPLGFFSRKLSETETRYPTYDRELLAMFAATKYFRPQLEGRQFSVYTDHKPLTHAFSQRSEKASPRQLNQLEYISQFTTDIRYLKGDENITADALSRIELAAMTTRATQRPTEQSVASEAAPALGETVPSSEDAAVANPAQSAHTSIDYDELANAQRLDDELAELLEKVKYSSWHRVVSPKPIHQLYVTLRRERRDHTSHWPSAALYSTRYTGCRTPVDVPLPDPSANVSFGHGCEPIVSTGHDIASLAKK